MLKIQETRSGSGPERILFEAADPDREGGSFGGYLPTLGIFLIFSRFFEKKSRLFYEIH